MTTAAVRGLSPVRHQLPNGAVALAQESPATPAVTINATMHVGSVDEPPTMPGLLYFTSRLIDGERASSTPTRSPKSSRGAASA